MIIAPPCDNDGDPAPQTTATAVWASRIRPHLEQTVEGIVAVGRLLIEAKADLGHGQFMPLLAELGLSRQMANRFMRVANNSVIANRSPVGALPAAVSVLDTLTQLSDEDLDAAIDQGQVTPATTRSHADALVALSKPKSSKATAGDAGKAVHTPASRPAPPAAPRRRPLTDQAMQAGWELRKAVERIERILADDRLAANKDQVQIHLRAPLDHAADVCSDLAQKVVDGRRVPAVRLAGAKKLGPLIEKKKAQLFGALEGLSTWSTDNIDPRFLPATETERAEYIAACDAAMAALRRFRQQLERMQ